MYGKNVTTIIQRLLWSHLIWDFSGWCQVDQKSSPRSVKQKHQFGWSQKTERRTQRRAVILSGSVLILSSDSVYRYKIGKILSTLGKSKCLRSPTIAHFCVIQTLKNYKLVPRSEQHNLTIRMVTARTKQQETVSFYYAPPVPAWLGQTQDMYLVLCSSDMFYLTCRSLSHASDFNHF